MQLNQLADDVDARTKVMRQTLDASSCKALQEAEKGKQMIQEKVLSYMQTWAGVTLFSYVLDD